MLLPALRHSTEQQTRQSPMTVADKPTTPTRPHQLMATTPFASVARLHSAASSSSSSRFPQTPTKKNQDMSPTAAESSMAESKKPCDISNLMSPPEPAPYDNFTMGSSASGTMLPPLVEKHQVPPAPLSPPISPFTKASSNISPEPTLTTPAVKDPILYPTSDVTPSPPKALFSPRSSFDSDAKRLVDEHLAARPASLFNRGTQPPQREEYELALYFKSEVMKLFQANPRGWLRKERELLAAYRKNGAGRGPSRLAPILAARPIGTRPQPIRTHATKVEKLSEKAKQPKQPKQPKAPKQPTRPARTQPGPVRNTINVRTSPDEPRVRTVAPNREDKDFDSLPDYSPPISSLPNKANSLKVDWKGNPLDLSKDPNAWRLHPDEISLAASLRLDCATYLTSKRRIFIRRLECARIGKEFRKTDAQQACKIDVNKASKLWTAFEKVGWLDIHWMDRHAKAM